MRFLFIYSHVTPFDVFKEEIRESIDNGIVCHTTSPYFLYRDSTLDDRYDLVYVERRALREIGKYVSGCPLIRESHAPHFSRDTEYDYSGVPEGSSVEYEFSRDTCISLGDFREALRNITGVKVWQIDDDGIKEVDGLSCIPEGNGSYIDHIEAMRIGLRYLHSISHNIMLK